MPFTEDLDTFFIDFKDSVIYDNAENIAFLDPPDEVIQVNEEDYQVRSVRKIDDGSLCKVSLTKTEE